MYYVGDFIELGMDWFIKKFLMVSELLIVDGVVV